MARRGMLAPISSIKHYVAQTNVNVATGVTLVHTSVDAVAKGALRSATNIVEEGAVIKAIHLEYWLKGVATSSTSQFVFIVYKLPSGLAIPDSTDMAALQAWPNKKNILFSSQGVLSQADAGQSIPVVRDWIKIPKGKQRFGLEDKFQIAIFTVGTLNICGLVVYKEYE